MIQIDVQKINLDYSRKIKNHFIINSALIIMSGIIWFAALFVMFSLQTTDRSKQLLEIKEAITSRIIQF